MQALPQQLSMAKPVPREAVPCAEAQQLKLEKGAPCRAPLSRYGPVAKLANAADYQSAAHLRASGFDPRLAYHGEAGIR